jgi:hypothetical protein
MLAGGRLEDQLPLAIEKRHLIVAAKHRLAEEAAVLPLAAGDHRQQGAAGEPCLGGLYPQQVEHGRDHGRQADPRRDDRGRQTGAPDRQRHAQDLLVEPVAMTDHALAVLEEELAVVGQEDDVGILGQSHLLITTLRGLSIDSRDAGQPSTRDLSPLNGSPSMRSRTTRAGGFLSWAWAPLRHPQVCMNEAQRIRV